MIRNFPVQPLVLIFTSFAFIAQVRALEAAGENRPLQLHPKNPHYLLFRGRPTILIGSTEHYGAVMNLDFDYIKYLDATRRDGMNVTRTFSGTYHEIPGSFGITDNTLSPKRYLGPWARTETAGAADGGNKFDLKKFDPAYWDRLKDFVAQAGKRGIVVEYVLFCPFYDENLWKVNPMNAANNINAIGACPRTEVYTLKHADLVAVHDAFTREAVRQLNGFDNLYFEICNEPYFGGVTEQWQAHIAQAIVDTEKDLPNKHLIAQNIANDRKKVDKPDPNVSIFNFHYATPPETVAMNYGLNKVIADDETGFRGKEDVHYRTEAWDFIIAGGAIYDNLDYSFTPGHPDGTLIDFKSPGGGGAELRKQLLILRKFMDEFDFIRMTPMNSAVKGGAITATISGNPPTANATVRVLGQAGRAYAIYIRGGSAAELMIELPAGRYQAAWVNTRTGNVDKSEQINHSGGRAKLTSPEYQQDVALRLRATAPPGP